MRRCRSFESFADGPNLRGNYPTRRTHMRAVPPCRCHQTWQRRPSFPKLSELKLLNYHLIWPPLLLITAWQRSLMFPTYLEKSPISNFAHSSLKYRRISLSVVGRRLLTRYLRCLCARRANKLRNIITPPKWHLLMMRLLLLVL